MDGGQGEGAAVSRRVLIVDDDALVSGALASLLRRLGRDVTCAGSLREAMNLLEGPEPFVHVVVDLILPDGDGGDLLHVTEQIRPRPQVVVMTGNPTSDRAASFFGKCAFLPKPVSVGALLHVLEHKDRASAFARRFELTERETQVLRLVLRGAPLMQAAETLSMRYDTYRTHKRRIIKKIGGSSDRDVHERFYGWLEDPDAFDGDVAERPSGTFHVGARFSEPKVAIEAE
jgi:DNA-binding NarL/FixJ family response regulator